MNDLVKSVKEFADVLNKTQKLPCSYGAGDCIVTISREGQDVPMAMCLKARQIGEVTRFDSWTNIRYNQLVKIGCPQPRQKHILRSTNYKGLCKYSDGKVHRL